MLQGIPKAAAHPFGEAWHRVKWFETWGRLAKRATKEPSLTCLYRPRRADGLWQDSGPYRHKGLRRLIWYTSQNLDWMEADRRVPASLSNRFTKRDDKPVDMTSSNSITGLTGWKAPETATHGLPTTGVSELDTHNKAIGP